MKDMESRGKQFGFPRLTFCSQRGDHHVRHISKEGLNPSLYNLSLEQPNADTLPHRNWLINTPLQGSPTGAFNWSLCPLRCEAAMPNWQESSHATLVVDNGVERLFISLSQITLIILPIVQITTTKGTLRLNLDSSGTTRNTASLSYPVIPHTWMCKMTNLSGLVHFPPNPTRFNG